MAQETIISADSHFVEPPEMWVERIDPAYRDRAPKLVREVDGKTGAFLVCENLLPNSGGGYFAAGTHPDELPEVLARGYDQVPEHVRDPAKRIEAQLKDGVSAEVLYSSYGMVLFQLDDGGLREACFRAFNDWASEFCAHDPKRLHGVGLIALDDVPAAVKELQRIAGLGLKGAMIWAEPPVDRPYSHPDYEPFWAAAQDLDMKMSLHSLTSRRKESDPSGHSDMLFRSVLLYQEIGRTLADFIIHGVCEKFPGLKIVSAENETAWLPFHLWRMDMLYEKLHKMAPTQLTMLPSEYFKRQIWATFIEDPFMSSTLESMGSTNIMWSTDFPHLASSYPDSMSEVDKLMGNLSDVDRRNIVHDNVARLYGIDI